MTARLPRRRDIVAVIVAKDARAFLSDRFWMFMTVLAVAWFVTLYYVLPDTVNETVRLGVHWTESQAAFEAGFGKSAEGVEWVQFATRPELEAALGIAEVDASPDRGLRQRLRDAFGGGEDTDPKDRLQIGIDYPEDFLVRVQLTMPTTVTVYAAPEVPPELRTALAAMVRESAYALTGQPLPISAPDTDSLVVGTDRSGAQIPLRERMKPLYAFLMLMMETFALGALVSEEVSRRTVTAILATPARLSDFLLAKVLVGSVLAFAEAALIMLLVGGFSNGAPIVAVALFMGAVLVTGVSLHVGASGRDFLGMIFYSMLFLIPLVIPALAELFPGTASTWIRLLPTYGLVRTIVDATSKGATWSQVASHLAGLAAWCALALASGWLVLRRKVETL